MHTYFDKMDKVTIAVHSNLRTNDWRFYVQGDDKRLAATTIKQFASNLKTALREAVGVDSRKDVQKKKKNSTVSKSLLKSSRKSGLGELKNLLLEVLQGK